MHHLQCRPAAAGADHGLIGVEPPTSEPTFTGNGPSTQALPQSLHMDMDGAAGAIVGDSAVAGAVVVGVEWAVLDEEAAEDTKSAPCWALR